jgi:hypothetical protein
MPAAKPTGLGKFIPMMVVGLQAGAEKKRLTGV